ncbi:putative 30S ribosomal protein S8 [Bifidobacterium minimum]|uniref:Putative 30S ribosomal protein S8 n=1 Tax=Bifidobacterium minimum TaxID=1693 RepID=A0A087BT24_9BIFI|nr:putative 30S ribosomal protein S8 [Bifidobacterium minimum]
MNPSEPRRCSWRHRFTYRCTTEYEPSNPCSVTSRSNTRLAVCRCLPGMNRSAASHPSTTGLNASSFEALTVAETGLGEQSCFPAYFLTVSRDTLTSLAIRRHDMPRASSTLIRCCLDTGTVIPFLSREPIPSTRETTTGRTGRCSHTRSNGLNPAAHTDETHTHNRPTNK